MPKTTKQMEAEIRKQEIGAQIRKETLQVFCSMLIEIEHWDEGTLYAAAYRAKQAHKAFSLAVIDNDFP
jgi:hypothetical protein